ncbi:MAG: nuclear transport factor 2 family protein [Candidatus Methylomirabilia bacterium]
MGSEVLAQWSFSAASLDPGQSVKFRLRCGAKVGEGLAINRERQFCAYVNRCAHVGTPLDVFSNEFFTEDGRHLICATHGAVYRPETGLCTAGPCSGASLTPLRVGPGGRARAHLVSGGRGMGRDDELAEVEGANARFYRAFESLSLVEMEAAWVKGAHVKCVHPGWALLPGSDAVRDSREAIFSTTGEIRFSLGDVSVRVERNLAWVTCTESILSQVRGDISATSVLTTNLFERAEGRWLMVHHHASHVFAKEAS